MKIDGRYFSDRYERHQSDATIERVSRHIVDGNAQRAMFGEYCIVVLYIHMQWRGIIVGSKAESKVGLKKIYIKI